MKLHLGCGQRYFEGYVNIDYPLTEHSVQQTSVADELHNLFDLRYKKETIDEVRLHHVFEHFSRAQACAMLAAWNSWLKPGGIVHIEVPDFDRTARAVLSPFSSQRAKSVGLRHIFGSQEAHWALHFEGYTPRRLRRFLSFYGFKAIKTELVKYKDIYNVTVIAQKTKTISLNEFAAISRKYLAEFMVADVPSEQILLETWVKDYEAQVIKSFAPNE